MLVSWSHRNHVGGSYRETNEGKESSAWEVITKKEIYRKENREKGIIELEMGLGLNRGPSK